MINECIDQQIQPRQITQANKEHETSQQIGQWRKRDRGQGQGKGQGIGPGHGQTHSEIRADTKPASVDLHLRSHPKGTNCLWVSLHRTRVRSVRRAGSPLVEGHMDQGTPCIGPGSHCTHQKMGPHPLELRTYQESKHRDPDRREFWSLGTYGQAAGSWLGE